MDQFDSCPEEIRAYLSELPRLLDSLPLDVSISYLFTQTQRAHNAALCSGAVKVHKANRNVARAAIAAQRMTIESFQERFETVFGKPIPDEVKHELEAAEIVRDRILNGQRTPEKEKRETIGHILDYAQALNRFVNGLAKFKPFGDPKGSNGCAESLGKSTTRWMLKGMGFRLS
ncbi:MAG: hypothetical protein ACYTAS_00415 [Planctomycetota bacterium]|jgi:hypothetical protein